jgi:hypothetical protein
MTPIWGARQRPAGIDAKQAWVISGWGVLDPLLRYNLAKKAGNKELVHLHDTFWLTEAAHEDASPPAMPLSASAFAMKSLSVRSLLVQAPPCTCSAAGNGPAPLGQ